MGEAVRPGSEDPNPFADLIGLKFLSMQDGSSRCQLEVTEHLKNTNGVVHGGVIFSLADTAMGGALYSTLDDRETCTTIEMSMKYLRPVTEGKLTCQARVIHKGKKIGHLESEVTNADRLVAKASATFSIIRLPKADALNEAISD